MGVTMDLSTADGAREALAALTTAFLAEGKEADVNRFRAVVQALSALLADYSRKQENELEGDIADLAKRLTQWEGDRGNIQTAGD